MNEAQKYRLWKEAVRTTRMNILQRLEEEVCQEILCGHPYCETMGRAIEIIEGKIDYPEARECLYCDEVYEIKDHSTCPNCAVNTDTKGITVIVLDKEEE
jgi:hypothetical protein